MRRLLSFLTAVTLGATGIFPAAIPLFASDTLRTGQIQEQEQVGLEELTARLVSSGLTRRELLKTGMVAAAGGTVSLGVPWMEPLMAGPGPLSAEERNSLPEALPELARLKVLPEVADTATGVLTQYVRFLFQGQRRIEILKADLQAALMEWEEASALKDRAPAYRKLYEATDALLRQEEESQRWSIQGLERLIQWWKDRAIQITSDPQLQRRMLKPVLPYLEPALEKAQTRLGMIQAYRRLVNHFVNLGFLPLPQGGRQMGPALKPFISYPERSSRLSDAEDQKRWSLVEEETTRILALKRTLLDVEIRRIQSESQELESELVGRRGDLAERKRRGIVNRKNQVLALEAQKEVFVALMNLMRTSGKSASERLPLQQALNQAILNQLKIQMTQASEKVRQLSIPLSRFVSERPELEWQQVPREYQKKLAEIEWERLRAAVTEMKNRTRLGLPLTASASQPEELSRLDEEYQARFGVLYAYNNVLSAIESRQQIQRNLAQAEQARRQSQRQIGQAQEELRSTQVRLDSAQEDLWNAVLGQVYAENELAQAQFASSFAQSQRDVIYQGGRIAQLLVDVAYQRGGLQRAEEGIAFQQERLAQVRRDLEYQHRQANQTIHDQQYQQSAEMKARAGMVDAHLHYEKEVLQYLVGSMDRWQVTSESVDVEGLVPLVIGLDSATSGSPVSSQAWQRLERGRLSSEIARLNVEATFPQVGGWVGDSRLWKEEKQAEIRILEAQQVLLTDSPKTEFFAQHREAVSHWIQIKIERIDKDLERLKELSALLEQIQPESGYLRGKRTSIEHLQAQIHHLRLERQRLLDRQALYQRLTDSHWAVLPTPEPNAPRMPSLDLLQEIQREGEGRLAWVRQPREQREDRVPVWVGGSRNRIWIAFPHFIATDRWDRRPQQTTDLKTGLRVPQERISLIFGLQENGTPGYFYIDTVGPWSSFKGQSGYFHLAGVPGGYVMNVGTEAEVGLRPTQAGLIPQPTTPEPAASTQGLVLYGLYGIERKEGGEFKRIPAGVIERPVALESYNALPENPQQIFLNSLVGAGDQGPIIGTFRRAGRVGLDGSSEPGEHLTTKVIHRLDAGAIPIQQEVLFVEVEPDLWEIRLKTVASAQIQEEPEPSGLEEGERLGDLVDSAKAPDLTTAEDLKRVEEYLARQAQSGLEESTQSSRRSFLGRTTTALTSAVVASQLGLLLPGDLAAQTRTAQGPRGAWAGVIQKWGNREIQMVVWKPAPLLEMGPRPTEKKLGFFQKVVLAGFTTVWMSGDGFLKLSQAEQQIILDQADQAGLKTLGFIDGDPLWILAQRQRGYVTGHYKQLTQALLNLRLGKLELGFGTDFEPYTRPKESGWNGDLSGYSDLLEEAIIPILRDFARARPNRIVNVALTRFEPFWYQNGHRTEDKKEIRGLRDIPKTAVAVMSYRDSSQGILGVSQEMWKRAGQTQDLSLLLGFETVSAREAGGELVTFSGEEGRIPSTAIQVFQGLSPEQQKFLRGLFVHFDSPESADQVLGQWLQAETGKATSGLEEGVYPAPVSISSHPLQPLHYHTTYLNRDLMEIQWLKERMLPDLLERNADTRTLRVALLGSSTGEEAARFWHGIVSELESRGYSVGGDSSDSWEVKILAVEVEPEILEEAKARFRGESPFVYNVTAESEGKRPGLNDQVQEYSKEVVNSIARYRDLIFPAHDGLGAIEWIRGDMARPKVLSHLKRLDLIVSNTASIYLPISDRRELWRTLLRNNPSAWIMSTDEYLRNAVEVSDQQSLGRQIEVTRVEMNNAPLLEPPKVPSAVYFLTAPPNHGGDETLASVRQALKQQEGIQRELRQRVEKALEKISSEAGRRLESQGWISLHEREGFGSGDFLIEANPTLVAQSGRLILQKGLPTPEGLPPSLEVIQADQADAPARMEDFLKALNPALSSLDHLILNRAYTPSPQKIKLSLPSDLEKGSLPAILVLTAEQVSYLQASELALLLGISQKVGPLFVTRITTVDYEGKFYLLVQA